MIRQFLFLWTLVGIVGCTTVARTIQGGGGDRLAVDYLDVSTGEEKATVAGSPEANKACYVIQPARADRITIDVGAARITVRCEAHFSDPTSDYRVGYSYFQIVFDAKAGHTYQVKPGDKSGTNLSHVSLLDVESNEVVATSDTKYEVPESNTARVFCSGCANFTGEVVIPAATLRLRVKWGANPTVYFGNTKAETTDATIEHRFLAGHTYLIQQGVRPDREFPDAAAHDKCAMFVDWTVERELISCEPTALRIDDGFKLPAILASAPNTARLICAGCSMRFDGLYSDVIVDAGHIETTVKGAEVRFYAEAGSTYFLTLEQSFSWNREFEEQVLRAKLWEPSAVIKENNPEKPFVKNCVLIVDWTENREFVDCFQYGQAKGIRSDIYRGDWELLKKVHSKLRSEWGI